MYTTRAAFATVALLVALGHPCTVAALVTSDLNLKNFTSSITTALSTKGSDISDSDSTGTSVTNVTHRRAQGTPATSCREILLRDRTARSGTYSLGNGMAAHCEMQVAGGGYQLYMVNGRGGQHKNQLRAGANPNGTGNITTWSADGASKMAEAAFDTARFTEVLAVGSDNRWVLIKKTDGAPMASKDVFAVDVCASPIMVYTDDGGPPKSLRYSQSRAKHGPFYHDDFGQSYGWMWTDKDGVGDQRKGSVYGTGDNAGSDYVWSWYARKPEPPVLSSDTWEVFGMSKTPLKWQVNDTGPLGTFAHTHDTDNWSYDIIPSLQKYLTMPTAEQPRLRVRIFDPVDPAKMDAQYTLNMTQFVNSLRHNGDKYKDTKGCPGSVAVGTDCERMILGGQFGDTFYGSVRPANVFSADAKTHKYGPKKKFLFHTLTKTAYSSRYCDDGSSRNAFNFIVGGTDTVCATLCTTGLGVYTNSDTPKHASDAGRRAAIAFKLDSDKLTCSGAFCYFIVHQNQRCNDCGDNPWVSVWQSQEAACQSQGGHLASIHSEAEGKVVAELCNAAVDPTPAFRGCWIGLNDINTEDTWVWSDGSGVTFKSWDTQRNEPSNSAHSNPSQREDCTLILPRQKPNERIFSVWRRVPSLRKPCRGG